MVPVIMQCDAAQLYNSIINDQQERMDAISNERFVGLLGLCLGGFQSLGCALYVCQCNHRPSAAVVLLPCLLSAGRGRGCGHLCQHLPGLLELLHLCWAVAPYNDDARGLLPHN